LRQTFESFRGQANVRQSSLFDPVKITQQLKTSILKAAITDFEIDLARSQIIPIPFSSDTSDSSIAEIQEDQTNLLEALTAQADTLISELSSAGNVVSEKLVRYFTRYRDECLKQKVNPRLLNRYGHVITRAANSDEVVVSLNRIDSDALNGFTQDHMELMRLYFREALARAQEIESAILADAVMIDDGSQFREIADLMDDVKDETGKTIVSKDVSVILRDIAGEMKDTNNAMAFATSPGTKEVLRARLADAFKTGSVYVARFVFFGALIAATTQPGVVGYIGSIASIVGLLEASSPGTIRSKYERLREFLPILPALPESKDARQE
jgi:hypothetical protein